MRRSLGMDISEGQRLIVFVDDVGGELFLNDLLKNGHPSNIPDGVFRDGL